MTNFNELIDTISSMNKFGFTIGDENLCKDLIEKCAEYFDYACECEFDTFCGIIRELLSINYQFSYGEFAAISDKVQNEFDEGRLSADDFCFFNDLGLDCADCLLENFDTGDFLYKYGGNNVKDFEMVWLAASDEVKEQFIDDLYSEFDARELFEVQFGEGNLVDFFGREPDYASYIEEELENILGCETNVEENCVFVSYYGNVLTENEVKCLDELLAFANKVNVCVSIMSDCASVGKYNEWDTLKVVTNLANEYDFRTWRFEKLDKVMAENPDLNFYGLTYAGEGEWYIDTVYRNTAVAVA